jgi:hypothetical protein
MDQTVKTIAPHAPRRTINRNAVPNRPGYPWAVLAICLLLIAECAAADLAGAFRRPPNSARPWVYWFWLNGNMTSNGITADLEAMKRAGIGGALIMEVDQGAPVGPVDFMSPSWRALFGHVHAEATRLGLEINMNNDAGWNGSGGPWIKPEQSMQEVTWSETNVAGPLTLSIQLPMPKSIAGFYRDIAVQAFPATDDYRIQGIESKAAFQRRDMPKPSQATLTSQSAIHPTALTNLSERVDSSGKLIWDVPAGQWTILRLGCTCTGVENAPAPKTGRGLECDKLSLTGIEANYGGMMAKLAADTGIRHRSPKAGLVATHIDSWENGSQNWTSQMRQEFQQRRGYDLLPFLPVFTGRVVESPEISERFLWDLRQTVSDLVIENYARHFRHLAAADRMRFTVEAYGAPCDSIPYGGQSDEPMGEFWTPGGTAMETCRGMASAGHIYGKRIIGAEAFTSGDQERWREHPASLKALGDRAFCEGINRFVFHRYAMQPWIDYRPGMTMGPWGQHYERTQTWWEQSRAWHEYLARCQYLLRQGLFVADICYVQPESPPQGFGNHRPIGYGWDECTDDAVLTRMSVRDGRIMLPDGMSYRLLALSDARHMTPRLLRQLKLLVEAGATVLGPRPLRSPSLSGYPRCDAEVDQLSQALWGPCDGQRVLENRVGRGRVFWGMSAEKVLQQIGTPPDFVCSRAWPCIHRSTKDADLYFVANGQAFETTATCAFRVTGKVPELWWPDTGRLERASVYQARDGVTRLALTLGPSGSVFVVFRSQDRASDPIAEVRRDGVSLLAATSDFAPRIVVRRARYGLLDDPQRSRDVTDRVQQLADAGSRDIAVAALSEGGDPAPGAVKTLGVDFTLDGQAFSVQARDGDFVHLARNATGIHVEKALYGVLDDPKRTRDVREKLQRILDSGEISFSVARMAAGDDPAFGVVKTLEVDYSVGGRRLHLTGTDPEMVDLFPEPAPPASMIKMSSDRAGRAVLEARAPGVYEWKTASGKSRSSRIDDVPSPVDVTGPWEVQFDPQWGGPKRVVFDRLADWAKRPEAGIRHYSGTAIYRTQFAWNSLSKTDQHQARIYLDLGKVAVMAEVKLNGQNLGLLWKTPFRVEVSQALRPGNNTLEVRIVNLWINRMIGDEQLPEDSERNSDGTLKRWPPWVLDGKQSPAGRFTFTSWRLWKKDSPLAESGLLGPVTLQTTRLLKL